MNRSVRIEGVRIKGVRIEGVRIENVRIEGVRIERKIRAFCVEETGIFSSTWTRPLRVFTLRGK